MKNKRLFILFTGRSMAIVIAILICSLHAWAQNEPPTEQGNYQELKEKFDVLEKDRDNLLAQLKNLKTQQEGCKESKEYLELKKDRDNILAQVETLLQEKSQIKDLKGQIKKTSVYNEKLTNDKAILLSKIEQLEEALAQQEQRTLSEAERADALKTTIQNMKLEYAMLDEIKAKLTAKEREIVLLNQKLQGADEGVQRSEAKLLEAKAAAEVYRRQIADMKKQYQEALAANKTLEKKIEDVPKKFAEIARENKMLVKETALMHYNLGVFYTENKEYRRAIAELEKALEINPDDAYAHFNLGYIYAEYIVDRKQAIEQFRQYLRLAKKDDKDVDWVKKYILTWQAWEGKRPLK